MLGRLLGDRPEGRAVARVFDSPVGPLVAAATDRGLIFLEFGDEQRLARQVSIFERHFGPTRAGTHPFIEQAERELAEYFAGRRLDFAVPLVIRGTPFQEQVWRALLAIPYGETRAYVDLAVDIGVKNGQRAVGLANGQNRIAIIIPCHRVIEKGGGLRGYGGGLWRKKFLLDLERRFAPGGAFAGTPLGALGSR
jgi:AraC family transcriptional regulator of adaptative response/methylated-DNA-[protein]-cysteine methyltransferase